MSEHNNTRPPVRRPIRVPEQRRPSQPAEPQAEARVKQAPAAPAAQVALAEREPAAPRQTEAARQIRRPAQQVQHPSQPAQRPVQQVQRPVQQAQLPTQPATQVQHPMQSAQRPAQQPTPAARPRPAGAARKRRRSKASIAWMVVRRTLLVILVLLLLVIVGVFSLCYTIANGPSPTIRNQLVLTATQTSAMKWVPGLFIPQEEVDRIVADSHVVREEEIDMSDFLPPAKTDDQGQPVDEWANAIDGMRFEMISGPTFKGYVLLIRDPARVYVSTSSDFKSGQPGMQIFTGVERDGAVAAINAGEFRDTGGGGDGGTPMGLTYSHGQMVWQDNLVRTFIGFDRDNKLFVAESMTRAKADSLGIRDAVSFQNGNTLITHEGESVRLHYNDANTGVAQRTAIGQRADGTVIMLVTDGRTAASLGATHNDVIDVMVSYGAVTAGMLDGGSSAMMYYRDWYEKYEVDISTLDANQRKGMVNKFKAFTPPRYIPTYFMVREEGAS